MNSEGIAILLAIVVQLALGVVVFQSNWHRKPNQCFLLLSLGAAAWLANLYFVFVAQSEWVAQIGIRGASASVALILPALNLFRVTLRRSDESWRQILKRSQIWLGGTLIVVGLCLTPTFLRGAQIVGGSFAPKPIYGPGVYIYSVFFAAAAVALIVSSIRDLRATTGGQHAELAFVMIGGILVAVFPAMVTVVIGRYVDPTRLLWFAPFRVVLFSVVVAYGISTRKIMEVGTLLRRCLSYLLLSLYLLGIYALVWWLVGTAFGTLFAHSERFAHIVAAIVVAFAMAPARGVSQRLAERLFISSHHLDFRATISKAADILRSVTTLRDLLARFADTIANAVGTERVSILLPTRGGDFRTSYVTAAASPADRDAMLPADGALGTYLRDHPEPIVLDELARMRPTREVISLTHRLRELNVALAIGIYSREHLTGVMLLGPRRSGRIYGTAEQETLQVLGRQLAVAIDNAELFTEVQNAKIYNETLLQNLTTGVIAAGTDEVITVFNNEAGQITELDATRLLGHPVEQLPAPVRDLLRQTLSSGQAQEDRELILRFEDGATVVRGSTSIFHGEDRQVMGALMVLTDITALKRLEMQIRRSDRLASLGTLSAGMAHEIKNPLVSIKTFAQLLPERYNDSDFRDTFSNLIGHEIDRIDSLVNQLLRFARPAKPLLQSVHLHEVLEKSLLLVGHRLYQKDIKLSKSWGAEVDTIRADPDQLEQVFLNFFINAMDAMKNGGELRVSTEISEDAKWMSALSHQNGDAPDILRVTIRDSGEGIRSEDLAHVFDPFFTTKDYGTGLGLSVVHGIVQEHGGQIEVESELHKGTAFHILLPAVRVEKKAAVA